MTFEDEFENEIIIDLRDENLKQKLKEQDKKQFRNIKFSCD